ncbi:KH domain-containing protein At4g18375 isoform X2 [Mercurialis annua]|uniref:KH domain-containing protein At4g18375 isoform X2 n=1 Tax=Mercurialis annua TaxID=3986 RepID=UPI00215FDA36|nr:KH domain-containing protein At4g18375 isoform X2 [Mercurialis annua]XP_050204114.1 KH domain-containing protein At4g18375 isoform X2 [Mercurialis annua]
MAGQRNDYGKRSNSQSDYGGGKRRSNPPDGEETDHHHQPPHAITNEDTVYRYLCPLKKIGSIIGRGGEIAKQLRSESKSNMRISEAMAGFDERIVTVYSSSEESNLFGDSGEFVCPAQDALFMVHDRIVAEDLNAKNDKNDEDDFDDNDEAAAAAREEDDGGKEGQVVVTVKMLVPADQIGCIIGKGGQVIQNIRSETGAQIRVLKDEHLPPLALPTDELLLIIGEPAVVRKALYQVATRLHENPSRSQHLLLSSSANMYQSSGGMFVAPNAGGASLMGVYGNYKGNWSSSYYSDQRDEGSSMEFSLRLVCPIGNIGSVIGKGGSIIKQIRQESRASIKVDSSAAEGDDCIIFISAKEHLEDQSATMMAAMRLQPRCSEKSERDSGDSVITTRLLVARSQIGCLMGKGGSIISEMRNVTRASIRILSEDNLPKVASEDDEMVQITGSHDVASNALLHVILRLKANLFGRDGALTPFTPTLPYIPVSMDMLDSPKYGNRDSQSRGRGYSSAGGYSSRDMPPSDNHGNNARSLSGGESGYGAYSSFSSGRSSGSGVFTRLSGQTSAQRKHHGY